MNQSKNDFINKYWEILENKLNAESARHDKVMQDIFEEINNLEVSDEQKKEYHDWVCDYELEDYYG